MKTTVLGKLEEVVLLVIAACSDDACTVSIWERVQHKTSRSITISAVHATLYRLEQKSLLGSHIGGATAEWDSRQKRFCTLTAAGSKTLLNFQALRSRLWQAISQGKLQRIGQ